MKEHLNVIHNINEPDTQTLNKLTIYLNWNILCTLKKPPSPRVFASQQRLRNTTKLHF